MGFITKFEKELRKRHHSLMTEVAKTERLIDAFDKGAKRSIKGGRSWYRQRPVGKSRWHRRLVGLR